MKYKIEKYNPKTDDILCGPTDWVEIEEFFNDLHKLFY